MSYDPKCYELANHFLPETCSVDQRDEAAQRIQDAIEDYLEEIEVDPA